MGGSRTEFLNPIVSLPIPLPPIPIAQNLSSKRAGSGCSIERCSSLLPLSNFDLYLETTVKTRPKSTKMAPFDRRNQERRQDDEDGPSILGVLFFGLIGATATTIAAGRLRTTIDWFYNQLKSRSYSSWTSGTSSTSRGSNAWNRYNRRMQEEYEEEMERLERIRRMQNVFNRERSKYKKTYEAWRENGPGAYQHFQRDDWYWKADTSYKDQRTNCGSTPRGRGKFLLSHHYSVLGLDRSRTKPYSDAEIKTAFRSKAMEYHPDQNQSNKKDAEAKFKEVMMSYEAIKQERKNVNP